jgi:hypothetical protein
LLVEGVGQAAVAGVAGQHRPGLPGGSGDRGHPGVVLTGPGVGVAVGVIAELGKHPGTEDLSEPGLAAVDLNVRVPAKTRLHLTFQHVGLAGQLGDHRKQCLRGGGVGTNHTGTGRQLLGAQPGNDVSGPGGDVALASGPPQRRADLVHAQPGALLRGGGQSQHGQRVTPGQIGTEHGQCAGVVLTQHRAQRVGLTLT